MKFKRIKETCLYVQDLSRTQTFYCDKLGLSLLSFVKDRHVFFGAGESVLLCFLPEKTKKETLLPPHGASGCIHFAFEVSAEDYVTTQGGVEQAAIDIIHRHKWPNGKRSFYFHDPDGHLVEIVEEGLWSKAAL